MRKVNGAAGEKEGVAEGKEKGKFRLVSFGSQQVMPVYG